MGTTACRAVGPEVCRDRGCRNFLEDGDQEIYLLDDDVLLTQESLFEREITQRKQWAKSAGVTLVPAVSSAAGASPLDFEALFQKDLKDVQQSKAPPAAAGQVDFDAMSKKDLKEIQQKSSGTVQQKDSPAAAASDLFVGETAPPKSTSSTSSTAVPAAEAPCESQGEPEVIFVEKAPDKQLQDVEAQVPAVEAARTKKKQQPRQKPAVRNVKKAQGGKQAESVLNTDPSCPSSKKDADFEKELKQVKRKMKQGKDAKSSEDAAAMLSHSLLNSPASAGERDVKRYMFISFYREQYAKLGKIEVADNFEENASMGLKIKNGHRPMPKPKTPVNLPDDYKKPLGSISAEALLKYNYESQRMLICVHGDLFDVSDRPDKYGKEGPYWAMPGHDITWGLVCGNDDAVTYDQHYDTFKILPQDMAERKLMGLMSWWCFYEKEYGEPVGRLKLYDEEWKLPTPPEVGDVCSIM